MKSFQEPIGVLEQQLDDLSEDVQNDLKKAAEKRIRGEQGAQLAEVADQVETAKFTEKVLKQQVERQRESLASTSVRKMDLEFLQFDLAQATEVHRRIKQRIESMETESQAPGRVFAHLEAVQAVPTKTHKIPRIILASAAGF